MGCGAATAVLQWQLAQLLGHAGITQTVFEQYVESDEGEEV
jgi:hypothetical protein